MKQIAMQPSRMMMGIYKSQNWRFGERMVGNQPPGGAPFNFFRFFVACITELNAYIYMGDEIYIYISDV